MSIYLTGSTGFIGKNLIDCFDKRYSISTYSRNSEIVINQDVVIHLAGIAHDLKNVYNLNEYYKVNTDLTKKIFDAFINSNAKVFIFLSSVKAVADVVIGELTEEEIPNPGTHYGKSKLLAEKYILSKDIPKGNRVYILRPCMIHGPGNKGNLNLLYNLVSKGLPWPLGMFENSRSYLSIENFCFIIKELICREDIPSGVYNVADDVPLSTIDVIRLMAESNGNIVKIINLSTIFIRFLAHLGDFFKLPFNLERLQKLTESYVVCNAKIKGVLVKPLPVSTRQGLINTFNSFSKK
jgi:nucleoside-diphosphate-sugar epimerase